MSSHSRYSSLYGSNHPSTHSMNADVLQNEVVQNAFLSSNYGEVQNTPTRFLEQSGSCLVDGILKRYPSAGQQIINKDLTLLWEGEQYPFPYDERNDNDGPSRESSTGPIVTFPHPTSSTHPSPSSASTASTHHKNALPWPQAPPTDCPWGDIYDVNGNMGKCVWKSALLTQAKTLQHWAWYHVTNDVFAFQTGILTDLQEAKIVNTPEKLECAILHLGLCPNQACQETVPCTVRAYRQDLVERHLKHSPECEPFFEDLSVKGYRELGKQLGYVWPGPKSQPQRSHTKFLWLFFLSYEGMIENSDVRSYKICLVSDVPRSSAAEGHLMGFSGVPVRAQHQCPSSWIHSCGLVDRPTNRDPFAIRGGNNLTMDQPSSSQVTIEDYDERFGIVPPNSSTHGNQFQIQSPYRTAHPTGMQEAYISSHSSLTGWRVAVSGSMATNLASLVNPGSSDPAPAFSTPGHSLSLTSNPAYVHEFLTQQTPHWPAALPWVDGEQRSSSANPTNYKSGPEPSAGGDGLPVRGHGSPGNQLIDGNSPAEVASIFPHGLPPTSSSSFQSFPTQGRISPHPSKIPCPYGPKYSTPVPCYRSTYLRSPFKHWMVHIRDQLWAIRRCRLKLRDASVINTHKKHKSAKKYISDFCPACNESFLTSREVQNHMMSSPQCSQFFCCKNCGTGAGASGGEIGYSHPERPDLSESDNERAAEMAVQSGVEQDLKNREVKRGQKGDGHEEN
ncbi:hypothetical protein BU17DRAFT_63075 [Hysterangium stoloniferum]|nr:hypothetical protein BU17DRAFT_63075 [Hysterangium stoloniferum]